MPADPEPPPSPVETMLRDAARQRRAAFDAAGPDAAKMPSPVRARLHGELARRFGDAPADPARSWLPRWWPALAGAAGVAALALFVVIGQPRPPAANPVASNAGASAPAPLAKKPDDLAPAPPPAAPATTASAPAAATIAQTKDAPLPAARPSDAEPVRSQTFTQSPLPLATTAARSAAVARRPALAAAPATAPATDGRRQEAAAPSGTALLGNFRFEQRGENVRVVDADGSVYVGQVEPPVAMKTETASRAQSLRAADQARSDKAAENVRNGPTENFRFRATGDNRTLRKPVVFEGEYSTQQLPLAPAAKTKAAEAEANQPTPGPAEAQIRGRVRVLDGRSGQRDAAVDARAVQ